MSARAAAIAAGLLLVLAAPACSDSAAPAGPSGSAPPPGPGPSPASLSGVVTAGTSDARISGAGVSIVAGINAGRSTTTNNGDYRFADLQPGDAVVSVRADGYAEQRRGVQIEGDTTLNVELTGAVPPVTFGPGQHRIGSAIAAGRYFSDPAPGCYWERQSGTSGSAGETIAFGFFSGDAAQAVVDIQSADAAFQTNDACGTWSNQPRASAGPAIAPGIWLVGAQASSGTYRAAAAPGCTWERLRDFAGTTASVIATHLAPAAGTAFATIEPADAGFSSNAACGSWTPVGTIDAPPR